MICGACGVGRVDPGSGGQRRRLRALALETIRISGESRIEGELAGGKQRLGLLELYGAALAKARGAARVIGIDPVAARRDLARRFGVDLALDASAAAAAASGAEVVIEE